VLKFCRKIINSLQISNLNKSQIRGGRLKSKRGQIAVVLLLIVAIALVLYGLVLNINHAALRRVNITVASNTAAFGLASQLGSYGQKLFKEQMGGEREICKGGGGAGGLGLIIGLVVLIIVAIFTLGIGAAGFTALSMGMQFLIVFAIAFSVSMISQGYAAITAPAQIAEMWNKMMEGMSKVDQYSESGIQTAMSIVVDDRENVVDFFDLDSDTFFGYYESDGANHDAGDPKDEIGRYMLFYTERMREAQKANADNNEPGNGDFFERDMLLQMVKFRDGLADFLYDNPDNLTDDPSEDPRCLEKPYLVTPFPPEGNPSCDPYLAPACSTDDDSSGVENPAYDKKLIQKCGQRGRVRDYWALFDPMPVRVEEYYPYDEDMILGSMTDEVDPGESAEIYSTPVPYYYFPRVNEESICHYDGRDPTTGAPDMVPAECNFCCAPSPEPDVSKGWKKKKLQVTLQRPICCDCAARAPGPEYADGSLCETYHDADGVEQTYCPVDHMSCDGSPGSFGGPEFECGSASTCNFLSPYSAFNPITEVNYPYVYHPVVDNWENNINPSTNEVFHSVKDEYDWISNPEQQTMIMSEEFGRDDENVNYYRDPRFIDGARHHVDQPYQSCGKQDFRLEDVTGYQVSLQAPAVDQKKGTIYPFLYKLTERGMDLSNLHPYHKHDYFFYNKYPPPQPLLLFDHENVLQKQDKKLYKILDLQDIYHHIKPHNLERLQHHRRDQPLLLNYFDKQNH